MQHDTKRAARKLRRVFGEDGLEDALMHFEEYATHISPGLEPSFGAPVQATQRRGSAGSVIAFRIPADPMDAERVRNALAAYRPRLQALGGTRYTTSYLDLGDCEDWGRLIRDRFGVPGDSPRCATIEAGAPGRLYRISVSEQEMPEHLPGGFWNAAKAWVPGLSPTYVRLDDLLNSKDL